MCDWLDGNRVRNYRKRPPEADTRLRRVRGGGTVTRSAYGDPENPENYHQSSHLVVEPLVNSRPFQGSVSSILFAGFGTRSSLGFLSD